MAALQTGPEPRRRGKALGHLDTHADMTTYPGLQLRCDFEGFSHSV
jgi:hypothetical protein